MLLSVGAVLAIVTGIVAFFSLGFPLLLVGVALLALRIWAEARNADVSAALSLLTLLVALLAFFGLGAPWMGSSFDFLISIVISILIAGMAGGLHFYVTKVKS